MYAAMTWEHRDSPLRPGGTLAAASSARNFKGIDRLYGGVPNSAARMWRVRRALSVCSDVSPAHTQSGMAPGQEAQTAEQQA